MLSLGKLSQVAQATHDTLDSEPVQRAIEGVDDLLDLVNSQQNLEQQFRLKLSATELRAGVEQQAEIITSRVAPRLADRPAFAHVSPILNDSVTAMSLADFLFPCKQLYASLTAKLLRGQSLTPEDLVDLHTLKTNAGEQAGDFAAALEILVRAKVSQPALSDVSLSRQVLTCCSGLRRTSPRRARRPPCRACGAASTSPMTGPGSGPRLG